MSKNYADPVNHSTSSAAIKTGTEAVKGAAIGAVEGPVKGGLFAGLAAAASGAALLGGIVLLGGATLAVISPITMPGALVAAGWAAAVGGTAGGAVGLTGGVIGGTLVGPVAGMLKGVSHGREIVEHDRGMAELSGQQQATAMAQAQTAQALQTGIMEQAQMRQHQHETQMITAMAGPQIQSQGAQYMGRMNEAAMSQDAVKDAVIASEAGHAAAVEKSQLDAANAEQQLG